MTKGKMQIDNLLKELYDRQQGAIKLDLKNIKRLANRLGHPERKIQAIHVAGSNGKGSTCAFLFSILKEAGCCVGLYTSPHLKHFNERIRINERYIPDRDIARLYSIVKRHMEGNETFFEITTMMAFLYFAEKKADIAIIEVGLGGRLDATNLITPLVSVITRIDLEHTNILGKTIWSIAYEKAGIIKKNVPVLTGARGKALAVIKKIARERKAPLVVSLSPKKTKEGIAINGYRNLTLGLKGDYQARNAALAVAVVDALKKKNSCQIPEKAIIVGLKKARWPGRLEYIAKNILMDCAHNAAGMLLLEKELKRINKKKIMVMGILKDKDIPKMMQIAGRNASLLILTTPNSERAADPLDIAEYAQKPCLVIPGPSEALKEAKRMAGKGGLIVLTGSIYLMGEYLDPLQGKQL